MSWNNTVDIILPPNGGSNPHITPSSGGGQNDFYNPRDRNHDGDTTDPGDIHGGVDINYEGGQTGINLEHPTIHSPINGTVTFVGGQYGTIKIRDTEGNSHEILHTDSQSVSVGQQVTAGEAIGTMGGRGPNGANDYAQHVHYQMKDSSGHRINSQEWWDNHDNDGGGTGQIRIHPPKIIDTLQDLLDDAEQASSPIVLDLDGNGVETVGKNSGIHFDHDGNSFAQLTGWVSKDDGLLVLDRNGNGKIENGAELFGNNTQVATGEKAANGFAALVELDSNDAEFANLKVWKDADSDGLTDQGELHSLTELGIASLDTGYTNQKITDTHGNQHMQTGAFTTDDGARHTMTDVWFLEDPARTVDLNLVEIPDEIAAMPDITAFGNVHDLQQTMARDESGGLRALVGQFAAENDANESDDYHYFSWQA